MKKKLVFAAVIAIVLYGGFLRLHDLGEQSLWIDEGYSINAALSILETGFPRLPSGFLSVKGWLTNYLIAGSMRIFSWDPFNPWPARLPSVVFGTLLIPAAYLVVRRFFGRRDVALVSALAISLSDWLIAWSRQARGFSGLTLSSLLLFFFLWKFWQNGTRRDAYASFCCFAVGISFHPLAIAFSPFFITVLVARLIKERCEISSCGLKRENRLIVMAAIAVFAAASVFAMSFGTFPHAPFKETVRLTLDFLGVPFVGSFLGIITIFLFGRRGQGAFFGLALAQYYAIIFFFMWGNNLRYLVPIVPIMTILAVYGFIESVRILISVFIKEREAWKSSAAAFVTLAILVPSIRFMSEAEVFLGRDSPQPDFNTAFQAIKSMRKKDEAVISPYTQFHRIYLGERGIWLVMSLVKSGDPLLLQTYGGKDIYAGAPILHGSAALSDVISRGHGYVLLDGLAAARLNKEFAMLSAHPSVSEVFHRKNDHGYHVWVFKF